MTAQEPSLQERIVQPPSEREITQMNHILMDRYHDYAAKEARGDLAIVLGKLRLKNFANNCDRRGPPLPNIVKIFVYDRESGGPYVRD